MKKRILNIGCGNDTYGTHFVDMYPTRKEVIKCNIDNEKLPFPNNFFDEVYSRNLLEHLKNPGFALKEMVNILKPGGKLMIITDNAGYLSHHINFIGKHKAAHQGNGYNGAGKSDRHFSLFTKMHLINHMEEVGMKDVNITYEFPRFPTLGNFLLVSFCSFLLRFNTFKDVAYPLIIVKATKKL